MKMKFEEKQKKKKKKEKEKRWEVDVSVCGSCCLEYLTVIHSWYCSLLKGSALSVRGGL